MGIFAALFSQPWYHCREHLKRFYDSEGADDKSEIGLSRHDRVIALTNSQPSWLHAEGLCKIMAGHIPVYLVTKHSNICQYGFHSH